MRAGVAQVLGGLDAHAMAAALVRREARSTRGAVDEVMKSTRRLLKDEAKHRRCEGHSI